MLLDTIWEQRFDLFVKGVCLGLFWGFMVGWDVLFLLLIVPDPYRLLVLGVG